MGTTGVSTGVHLHFQIDKGSSSSAIDPYDYVFNGKELVSSSSTTPSSDISKKSVDELAKEVIAGKYGNGDARRNALGSRYSEVQHRVNEILAGNTKPSQPSNPTPSVDILTLVKKTIRGDFGNGADRRKALGSNYDEVQRQVNLNFQHATTRWDNIKLY